jgi:hypothetical protein
LPANEHNKYGIGDAGGKDVDSINEGTNNNGGNADQGVGEQHHYDNGG